MKTGKTKTRIAILGGGPSGLFMYKRLVSSGRTDFEIDIFERKKQFGAGMPYSIEGANDEHITNVSANEIPDLVTSIETWIQTLPEETLGHFHINKNHFNDYKVLPRLLFGQYLSAQFDLLQIESEKAGIVTKLHPESNVTDVIDKPGSDEVWIEIAGTEKRRFDYAIICTGHHWPKHNEGKIPRFYDSPYPPAKLAIRCNHAVAIKGSSLTAIDAIRTLARCNGNFSTDADGKLSFKTKENSEDFRLVMHSRSGLLPAVRFHLEESHLTNSALLTPDEIAQHMAENNGFLSLDFIFEKDFKEQFRDKDPEFYARIKDMDIEAFVDAMMELRERLDPFVLLRAEYAEAEKSIKRHESVYWKEMLAVLSFAMNYPAKHFPAEDMRRLQKVLMPLISIVIAFVPQASCKELLALHEAGVLEIVAVGADSNIVAETNGGATYHYTDDDGKPHSDYYQTFVDCVGQPHLSYSDFPFRTLVAEKAISPARLQFRSDEKGEEAMETTPHLVERDADGSYFLKVPGITINDNFQVLDQYGAYNPRLYIMAVAYIGGFNPDYSGLDFCEAASKRIMETIAASEVKTQTLPPPVQ